MIALDDAAVVSFVANAMHVGKSGPPALSHPTPVVMKTVRLWGLGLVGFSQIALRRDEALRYLEKAVPETLWGDISDGAAFLLHCFDTYFEDVEKQKEPTPDRKKFVVTTIAKWWGLVHARALALGMTPTPTPILTQAKDEPTGVKKDQQDKKDENSQKDNTCFQCGVLAKRKCSCCSPSISYCSPICQRENRSLHKSLLSAGVLSSRFKSLPPTQTPSSSVLPPIVAQKDGKEKEKEVGESSGEKVPLS